MFTLLLSALTIATAGGDGLPVKTPRSVGMSAARLAKIDHVIMRGIQAGGYPGAAVVVGRKGALVWERGFGGVRAALHEPAWLWIGGVMSVFIVFAITVGPPRIGVTATVATVIAGNLVSAAIIDRFGLFGVPRVGLAWPRVLGFVLLALGAGQTLKR